MQESLLLFSPRKMLFFLCRDKKASVPLGLPVSKKQTAILMLVEYKESLPDHNFPIGKSHELISYVYASCLQKEDETVGMNGPTYIAIRSEKHDKSSAALRQEDF